MNEEKLKEVLNVLFRQNIEMWREIGELSKSLNESTAQTNKEIYKLYEEIYNPKGKEEAHLLMDNKEFAYGVKLKALASMNEQIFKTFDERMTYLVEYSSFLDKDLS